MEVLINIMVLKILNIVQSLTVPHDLFVKPNLTSILCVNIILQLGPSLILSCVFLYLLDFILYENEEWKY